MAHQPRQLSEAERVSLKLIQELPPIVVFALGSLSYNGNAQVMRLLEKEGFLADGAYLNGFSRHISDSVTTLIGELYPEPIPSHYCEEDGCNNMADPGQDLCIKCQDRATVQGVRAEELRLKKLLIQACERLEESYPVKGPPELSEWWEENRPRYGSVSVEEAEAGAPEKASNGNVKELHVEQHADGRITAKEIPFESEEN